MHCFSEMSHKLNIPVTSARYNLHTGSQRRLPRLSRGTPFRCGAVAANRSPSKRAFGTRNKPIKCPRIGVEIRFLRFFSLLLQVEKRGEIFRAGRLAERQKGGSSGWCRKTKRNL